MLFPCWGLSLSRLRGVPSPLLFDMLAAWGPVLQPTGSHLLGVPAELSQTLPAVPGVPSAPVCPAQVSSPIAIPHIQGGQRWVCSCSWKIIQQLIHNIRINCVSCAHDRKPTFAHPVYPFSLRCILIFCSSAEMKLVCLTV